MSAWLATLFHQSKLVVACLYPALWEGVQIKLVMPSLYLLEQYLRGTRTSNQGNQNLDLTFLEQQSDKERL